MKLDDDVRAMTHGERGNEVQRLRSLIRTHKSLEDNARCWLGDMALYDRALPEGSGKAGQMSLPCEVLLGNCKRYIEGQKRRNPRKPG